MQIVRTEVYHFKFQTQQAEFCFSISAESEEEAKERLLLGLEACCKEVRESLFPNPLREHMP